MKKSVVAIAVASLCTSISAVQAEETQNYQAQETIIVTANRFEQDIDSSIAPVTVITREEIENIQAQELLDVIRRFPGIQVASNGGYGKTQGVFVRGTSTNQLLVLVDGVRFGSATSGTANFSAIPLVAIERIEFLRGSRAAMYGADAVGGILNIITDNHRQGGEISLKAGSDNYQEVKGLVAGELVDNFHSSIAVSAMKTDGISATSYAGQEDDDAYKSRSVTVTSNYQLSPSVELGAVALLQKGEGEIDDSYGGIDPENAESVSSVVAHLAYSSARYKTKFVVGRNRDESTNYGYTYDWGYLSESQFTTDRTQFSWSNQYQLNSQWSVGGGIDLNDDKVSSTTDYEEKSRSNFATYLNAQYLAEKWLVEAAVRNDDNERYGDNGTWQLGAGYNFTEQYRITANTGTAFRAPTFNELYYPNYGTPTLKPEESENYEMALEANYDLANLRVSAYHNEITNMISTDSTTWLPVNYGEVEIEGIEFVADFSTGSLSHQMSYDYTDAMNKETDTRLIRRAKHSAKWNSSYQLDNWQFDFSYLYQGKRYDGSSATVVLDPYSLVDIAGSYSFDNDVKLSAKIGNLFDKEYETVSNYNSIERNYTLSLAYKF